MTIGEIEPGATQENEASMAPSLSLEEIEDQKRMNARARMAEKLGYDPDKIDAQALMIIDEALENEKKIPIDTLGSLDQEKVANIVNENAKTNEARLFTSEQEADLLKSAEERERKQQEEKTWKAREQEKADAVKNQSDSIYKNIEAQNNQPSVEGSQLEKFSIPVPEVLKPKKIENEEKIVKALEVLSMPDVMKRKPAELAESFENLSGRKLEEEREKMVDARAKGAHRVIIRGKEAVEAAKQKIMQREQERIWSRERSIAMTKYYGGLAQKEKDLFEKKGGVASPEFANYLKEKREKLGVSENAFASLVNQGFNVDKVKTRGWRTWFMGSPIEITSLDGKNVLHAIDRADLNKWAEDAANAKIIPLAEGFANSKIVEGRKILTAQRVDFTKIIIERAVRDYNLQKDQEQKDALIEELRAQLEELQARLKTKTKKPTVGGLIAKGVQKNKKAA